jgi:UDP-GlcNAc:undecaprenyl-phosphate GlcNAc-1-phosphate transferase
VPLVALFGVALFNDNATMAQTSLALLGALVGFYPFNHAPARIYLGDAGSLFLGYMLAALAMVGSYSHTAVVATLAPLTLLCVPLLELTLLTVARLHAGRAPWLGSPDHFALRLRAAGWSAPAVAAAAALVGALGAGSAALLICLPPPWAWAIFGADAALFAGLLTVLLRLAPPGRPDAAALAPAVLPSQAP